VHIEADLALLDDAAWNALKAKVVPCFAKRDLKRGWQSAFDTLNEAKGYNYLVGLGVKSAKFVPESQTHGQKTPDLCGFLEGQPILCEVKTINASDPEAQVRREGGVRPIESNLPDGFFTKLARTLDQAGGQLAAYTKGYDARAIILVVMNYDDALHESADSYLVQIQGRVRQFPPAVNEVVFDIKPPYYAATAESVASHRVICSRDAHGNLQWKSDSE